jgi:beta-lactamase regulating signal transducer with metallopeptidase domain
MSVLLAIALKSLLIAGLTLVVLKLMSRRSAAERSWVAHAGLLALLIMAFAPLILPSWNVQAPALLARSETPAITQSIGIESGFTPATKDALLVTGRSKAAKTAPGSPSRPTLDPVAAATAIYAVPAAVLLFITFLALARLVALQARADVLVDGHWLSALARAQRRMGFKHGTALLTSDELNSPISWGLMRPVILLNSRAVEATGEAEAIIAHELAHVARLDWIKLLLARVATALFWFNPLVWLLAREAHQLREETADDTVLAANIADTDYAQLLVGVARHECSGLLLGAHGVAPSKSSLARRVARVLDVKSARGPVARSFAFGVFVGAILIGAPLAALTFTSTATNASKPASSSFLVSSPRQLVVAQPETVKSDLPHIIAQGVSTSVTSAVAAATAVAPQMIVSAQADYRVAAPNGASVSRANGVTVSRAPNGATVTVYPPDARGRSKVVAVAANGATAISYRDGTNAAREKDDSAVDRAIEMKVLGVTPEYIAALRAASPALRNLPAAAFNELKAVGVTPDYVVEMARAGYGNLNNDDLAQARVVGIDPKYIQSLAASGFSNLSLERLVELRSLGVKPKDIERARRISGRVTAEQVRDMKAMGLLSNRDAPDPPDPPDPPDSRD